ncbi:hypothetical protein FA95DRAFT_1298003 [Auriscalpium vulgare]|uniref:Uncharacterized protein n=1 Tax=Auriscalpium vulgare TaxID=40419 RepID=A0ACB8R251_9AGAM|nr:hypothetical protein FA95DRAFT_1298003 [Auriscalpium vulgare]
MSTAVDQRSALGQARTNGAERLQHEADERLQRSTSASPLTSELPRHLTARGTDTQQFTFISCDTPAANNAHLPWSRAHLPSANLNTAQRPHAPHERCRAHVSRGHVRRWARARRDSSTGARRGFARSWCPPRSLRADRESGSEDGARGGAGGRAACGAAQGEGTARR